MAQATDGNMRNKAKQNNKHDMLWDKLHAIVTTNVSLPQIELDTYMFCYSILLNIII